MRILTVAIALLLLAAPARGGQPSAAAYSELVAKAKSGDADTDYTLLRLSYAETPDYDPYSANSRALFSEAWAAFQAKDCTTALAKADVLLDRDFTRIPVHLIREECLKSAGDTEGAARAFAIGKGLALSLLESGDGKAPATAFVVVTLSEESFVITNLGLQATAQSLITKDGKPYDMIEGSIAETGEKGALYFDVSHLMEGMNRQLKKGSP